MKKLFSLFLVLCMVCMMIPAMAEESITGEWYASFGSMNLVLTLAEDGSAQMSMPGSEVAMNGTWSLDGEQITITIDDAPAVGTYANGTITVGDEESSMSFTREKAEPITLAEANPSAVTEDFEGVWSIVYVGMGTMIVDATATDEALPGLVVENGSIRFTGESSMVQAFGDKNLPLSYADGKLSYSLNLGETSLGIELEMLEDGMLSLAVFMGGMNANMYFVKEAAEEPAA